MDKRVEFIEVNRIVSEGDMNVGSRPECYPIDSIFSFREWHKSRKDEKIAGQMTYVVFRPKEKSAKNAMMGDDNQVIENSYSKIKTKTILIEESYESFANRLASKVGVRRSPSPDEVL